MNAVAQVLEPLEAARPPEMGRLYNAEAAGMLERFDAAALMAEGKVNLISVEAIADRLGARWPAKQEQVYDHVDRTLGRHLNDRGIFVRVSETDFLVAQPDATKFGAQASCFRYLRELLTYFLGDHRGVKLDVLQVTKFSESAVEARPVDVTEVERGEAQERATREAESKRFNEWSPFVAANGRNLRVSCKLEPVLELKAFRRIGYRMARSVIDMATSEPISQGETQRLSRADLERIDLATISRGLDRMRSEAEGAKEPTLILPVSYVSLSNQRGRAAIVNYFKEAQAAVQRGLICEVTDIEGVPESALLSALTMMKPFCLFMVGRRTPPFGDTQTLAAATLQGASIECPRELEGDAEFVAWARQAVEAGKRVAKSVMLFGVPTTRHMAIAAPLGATHASLRSSTVGSPG